MVFWLCSHVVGFLCHARCFRRGEGREGVVQESIINDGFVESACLRVNVCEGLVWERKHEK